MANGEEDLREKNKDKKPLSKDFDKWRIIKGREDAEMLQEKSTNWKNIADDLYKQELNQDSERDTVQLQNFHIENGILQSRY